MRQATYISIEGVLSQRVPADAKQSHCLADRVARLSVDLWLVTRQHGRCP